MKRRKPLILLSATLLPVLLAGVAWACSCRPFPDDPKAAIEQAWSQSDAIVSGTVVALDTETSAERGEVVIATFQVARAWKGPKGPQFKVQTSTSSAACGYTFEANRQYLVAASQDGDRYLTGLCSLTRPLEEARALVRVLDARTEAK